MDSIYCTNFGFRQQRIPLTTYAKALSERNHHLYTKIDATREPPPHPPPPVNSLERTHMAGKTSTRMKIYFHTKRKFDFQIANKRTALWSVRLDERTSKEDSFCHIDSDSPTLPLSSRALFKHNARRKEDIFSIFTIRTHTYIIYGIYVYVGSRVDPNEKRILTFTFDF